MIRHRFALAWLPLVLGGCLRLAGPPVDIHEYQLDYPPPAAAPTQTGAVLRVLPFRAAAAYDRDFIVYRDGAHKSGTYFHHQWAANPAAMITDLMARDLAASGAFLAVVQGISPLAVQYDLSGELEVIEERIVPRGCIAHLRLRLLLARSRVRTDARPSVILHRIYDRDEPCDGNLPTDLVAAMSRALAYVSQAFLADAMEALGAAGTEIGHSPSIGGPSPEEKRS